MVIIFAQGLWFLEKKPLKTRPNIKMLPVGETDDFKSPVNRDPLGEVAPLPQFSEWILEKTGQQNL